MTDQTENDRMTQLELLISTASTRELKFAALKLKTQRERLAQELKEQADDLTAFDHAMAGKEPPTPRARRKDAGISRKGRAQVVAEQNGGVAS